MSERVAAVVLAAGLSSRMGTNKLFLELGGETVLRRAVAAAAAAGLDPVLVVVGNERDRVEAGLAGLPCTTVFNGDYARGINTSLRAGIAAVPGDAAGAVVILADMPFVSVEMVRLLVDRWRQSALPLAVSLYGEVLAPPTLYGKALFAEVALLDGDGCGKRVVKRHRGEAVELAWPELALTDLDVPGDLVRVRAQIEGG